VNTEPTPPGDAEPRIGVQVNVGVQPGPDGRPWVQFQINVGVTATMMLLPPATAEELGPILAAQLAEGAANARRAGLGLIVAPNGQLPPMPPHGGLPTNGARR
jgi:hypothetical protein